MRQWPRTRRELAATVLVAAVVAGACQDTPSASPSAVSYSVRGLVRQLPSAAGVPLLVEHEAIPDLVAADGSTAPMPAMTMPFATASDVDLSGLAVGDAVAMQLVVDWSAPSAMLVTAVTRLPSGTQLDLGSQPQGSPSAAGDD